jgi:hypothetical protein
METYENTLEDTMNTSGKDNLLEEIDIEKASYLLNVDDLLEEMLSRRLVTHGYF